MRYYLIFFLLFIGDIAHSQSEITFNFPRKDGTLKNPVKPPLFDSLITINRKIISNHEFEDFGIRCADEYSSECSMKFKVDEKQNWFVFFENRWKMLYDASTHKLQTVDIKSGGDEIIPFPLNEIADGKYALLCYMIINRKWHERDNNTLYWFHPQFGVVVIESGYSFWVREDFSKVIR
jgi:hypothetical protein